MELGKAIRVIRQKRNLNQSEFSKKMNITQSYLSLIESGKKNPSYGLLELMSIKLDAPLPILLWFSVDISDIKEEKKEAYKMLKPSIDSLLSEVI